MQQKATLREMRNYNTKVCAMLAKVWFSQHTTKLGKTHANPVVYAII